MKLRMKLIFGINVHYNNERMKLYEYASTLSTDFKDLDNNVKLIFLMQKLQYKLAIFIKDSWIIRNNQLYVQS